MLIAAIEAAVTERLAKVGDRTSIKLNPDSGLASLGTMIVDPGKIKELLFEKNLSVGLIVL